jgi:hypothetical protein
VYIGNLKMNAELKSTDEWLKDYPVVILDPDGWDRKNLAESWKEKITFEEFSRRVLYSTVQLGKDWRTRD